MVLLTDLHLEISPEAKFAYDIEYKVVTYYMSVSSSEFVEKELTICCHILRWGPSIVVCLNAFLQPSNKYFDVVH